MTTREQAEKLLSAAQLLSQADAVEYIEAVLRHTFIKGEQAALIRVQQRISQIGQPQEMQRYD